MSDDGKFAIFLMVVSVCFVAIVLSIIYSAQWASCSSKWSDYETRYSLFGGCRVQIGGKFIPEDIASAVWLNQAPK